MVLEGLQLGVSFVIDGKNNDGKDQRWQDQSKRNKVSSGGEATFLIVGSHLQFPMTVRSSVDLDR
jgi:hypothetical protein